jgi:hypothetical protein
MAVITGISGAINTRELVRDWSIAYKGNLAEYAASNTLKAKSALIGNKDWSGSFKGYGSIPEVMPGEAFSFSGTMDAVNGASGTAIIDDLEINCDIEGGKPIDYTAAFSGNGALVFAANTSADASLLLPTSAVGCKVELGTVVTVPVWTELTDVRNWKLKFSTDNKEYASSSTAGWKNRKKGAMKCDVSIGVYASDYTTLPAPGTITGVRLYDAASTYWLVNWIIWGEMTDIGASPEESGLVAATLNGQFRALALVTATITAGNIAKPGGTAWTW